MNAILRSIFKTIIGKYGFKKKKYYFDDFEKTISVFFFLNSKIGVYISVSTSIRIKGLMCCWHIKKVTRVMGLQAFLPKTTQKVLHHNINFLVYYY